MCRRRSLPGFWNSREDRIIFLSRNAKRGFFNAFVPFYGYIFFLHENTYSRRFNSCR